MLARRTSSSIAPPCVAAGGPLPQGVYWVPLRHSLVPTLRVGMPPATLRVASAVGRSARRGWQSTLTAEAAGQAGLGAPTFGPGREEQGLDYCRGKSQNLTPSPPNAQATGGDPEDRLESGIQGGEARRGEGVGREGWGEDEDQGADDQGLVGLDRAPRRLDQSTGAQRKRCPFPVPVSPRFPAIDSKRC
jgi:hypothetical protein